MLTPVPLKEVACQATAYLGLGGCEPQPKSHIAATLRLGTGQRALTAAPSTTLPYIGYPAA